MPRAALTAGAHRTDSSVELFDKLKFEANGEEARILIPNEDDAWAEWMHSLNLPVFEEDGSPLMETKEVRGVPKVVFADTWLGNPICLGREEVIVELGLDIERCPTCAGVKRMMDAEISDAVRFKPQQRFAVPVFRYDTQNKKSAGTLRNPPGGKILVWAMSAWTYRSLDNARKDIAELFDIQDDPGGATRVQKTKLQMVDFSLQCEFSKWQKISKIGVMRRAIDRSPQVKAMVASIWQVAENRPTDEQLQAACGRKSDREWMDRDIRDAEEAWARAVHWGDGSPQDASRGGRMSGGAPGARSLDSALADLLAPPPEAPADPLVGHPGGLGEFAPAGAAVTTTAVADDLFGSTAAASAPAAETPPWPSDDNLFGEPAVAPPADVPAAAPANGNSAETALGDPAAAAPAAGKVASFDDIMPVG